MAEKEAYDLCEQVNAICSVSTWHNWEVDNGKAIGVLHGVGGIVPEDLRKNVARVLFNDDLYIPLGSQRQSYLAFLFNLEWLRGDTTQITLESWQKGGHKRHDLRQPFVLFEPDYEGSIDCLELTESEWQKIDDKKKQGFEELRKVWFEALKRHFEERIDTAENRKKFIKEELKYLKKVIKGKAKPRVKLLDKNGKEVYPRWIPGNKSKYGENTPSLSEVYQNAVDSGIGREDYNSITPYHLDDYAEVPPYEVIAEAINDFKKYIKIPKIPVKTKTEIDRNKARHTLLNGLELTYRITSGQFEGITASSKGAIVTLGEEMGSAGDLVYKYVKRFCRPGTAKEEDIKYILPRLSDYPPAQEKAQEDISKSPKKK